MNSRAIGALGSAVLHAAMFVSFGTAQPTRHTKMTVGDRLADDVVMRLLPSEDSDGSGAGCPHSYRGIGIVSTYAGWVEEVVPGGPADKAGVQIGDKLLNGDMFTRDGFSMGRHVVIKIDRHGVRIDLPVVIGRVCYEEPQTIPHLKD